MRIAPKNKIDCRHGLPNEVGVSPVQAGLFLWNPEDFEAPEPRNTEHLRNSS